MADQPFQLALTISGATCKDFPKSSRLEWLQTNHTGAFAMGTVCGANTRRYHGLLVASLSPPSDRYSIFPRVEEIVTIGGLKINLATVQYPNLVSPAGYELLEEFSASPIPTWHYVYKTLTIIKSLRLLDKEQSVQLVYLANSPCELDIRLFVSFRDYHSLMKSNSALDPTLAETDGYISLQPYKDLPALHFHHNAESFTADGIWFNNNEYLRESERGLDFCEDLYSPGVLHYSLHPDKPAELIGTLETNRPVSIHSIESAANTFKQALDQFRVSRSDNRPTLIAGYPWFTDWSRDTLISLPAFVALGFDPTETKGILQFLLEQRKQGILPNRFSDKQSTPEYNTVDASLWFFIAAHTYIEKTSDSRFLEQILFPAAMDIIGWHMRGTFYGIHVDAEDRLLTAGEPGVQLTWMDAKIGDHVVTPRTGKPVEINALWFNALCIASKWGEALGKVAIVEQLSCEAQAVKKSFAAAFWNAERQCLYDVVTAFGTDASVRPNQLLAISLPYPLLSRDQARDIVKLVECELLTPVGLRTLEPSHPDYRGRFQGDMHARDSAYHQGTVWPWLMGPFIQGYLYAFDHSSAAQQTCRDRLQSMVKLMTDCCLGSISEVYDGDAPHNPGGCPAQLWSVAQIALAMQSLGALDSAQPWG